MGAVAAIFKMADIIFFMFNVSANNIDRKLIIVSMSMFSGSRNPNKNYDNYIGLWCIVKWHCFGTNAFS